MTAGANGPTTTARPEQAALADRLPAALRDSVRLDPLDDGRGSAISCPRDRLRDLCHWLFQDSGHGFATLIVEETATPSWSLTYVFYAPDHEDWVHVRLEQAIAERAVPSISGLVHAADWHERETEDLFGLVFEGHPRLGEFILHEDWPEGTNPMRKSFDARQRHDPRGDILWKPPKVVEATGAFAMPVGPVFSGFAESAHFLLETVGEDVITAIPRFFYKYRGVEKIAEGRTPEDTLLLAERFSGNAAFAHGLAFCQALEDITGVTPPPRARRLRAMLAELERLRHHAAAIKGICESTGLAVATSQAALIEEDLLRLTGAVVGHRYLFGVLTPGGLARDFADETCHGLAAAAEQAGASLSTLERMLDYTSSFLDRLEEVGIVSRPQARDYGLVGPIARASGIAADLRRAAPYAAYDELDVTVPTETEGDGYARLRVLFREAEQSVAIIRQAATTLPTGAVSTPVAPREGAALGIAEAPLGATFHWLRLDGEGRVARYRPTPPSFANWHGFHLAAENFAFQDFPIIMASFGLSNAECDR